MDYLGGGKYYVIDLFRINENFFLQNKESQMRQSTNRLYSRPVRVMDLLIQQVFLSLFFIFIEG